jgi:hypothetical protein
VPHVVFWGLILLVLLIFELLLTRACFVVVVVVVDVRGDVKIFDFGLAKEVRPGHDEKDGAYNLTGDTGSPRYMVCSS